MTAAATGFTDIAERFVAEIPSWSPAIVELVKSDKAYHSIENLERLIGSDPEFSLRVLAMANSAFYSQHETIDTLRSALVVLGDRMVQRLAAGMLARSLVSGTDNESQAIWRHSVAVAVAARLIARLHRELIPDRAHLVGLLHNIGRLAILRCEPDRYAELKPLSRDQRADKECLLFGRRQSDLGADIALMIGLPESLAEAIRFCERSVVDEDSDPMSLTVRVAHYLCAKCGYDLNEPADPSACVAQCIAALGLIGQDLETLAVSLGEQIEAELALLAVGV